MEQLIKQKELLENTIHRLQYKVSRYKLAVETGILSWECED